MEKKQVEDKLNELERKIKNCGKYDNKYWNNHIKAEITKTVISAYIKKIIIDDKIEELTKEYQNVIDELENDVIGDLKEERTLLIARESLMFQIILSDTGQHILDQMGCFLLEDIKAYACQKERNGSKLYDLIKAVELLDDIKGLEKRKIDIISKALTSVLDKNNINIYKRAKIYNISSYELTPQTTAEYFNLQRKYTKEINELNYLDLLDEESHSYTIDMNNTLFDYHINGPKRLNINNQNVIQKQKVKRLH